jgi:hypothetical protein
VPSKLMERRPHSAARTHAPRCDQRYIGGNLFTGALPGRMDACVDLEEL